MNFNRACQLVLIGCGAIFLAKFAQLQTHSFTIRAISSNHGHIPRFDTRPLLFYEKTEVKEALSQPYRYYGRGGQVYAFLSQDNRYVLKFFKQRLFRPSWLLNHLPLPKLLHHYRNKKNWKRKDKFERDFFSYKAAFNQMQEESGLLYCHLNPTSTFSHKIQIIDPIGICHNLPLDQFDFILQKKAERVKERLKRLQSDSKAVRQTFREIIKMTKSCIDKGYYNRDPFIPHNCGFVDERAIQIDVGRFIPQSGLDSKKELGRILSAFEEWLTTHFPQLVPLFQEEVCQW